MKMFTYASLGHQLLSGLLAGLVLAAGCSHDTTPQSLAPEAVPAAIQAGFDRAKPEIKKLADQALQSFLKKEYAQTLALLQTLCGRPDLTKRQREIATQFLLTATSAAQAAQSQGDAKADATVKFHQLNK